MHVGTVRPRYKSQFHKSHPLIKRPKLLRHQNDGRTPRLFNDIRLGHFPPQKVFVAGGEREEQPRRKGKTNENIKNKKQNNTTREQEHDHHPSCLLIP
jgi:hypothetical protein